MISLDICSATSAVRQPESFPILQGFERQRDMGRRLVSEGAVADLQREDRDVPEVEKMIDAVSRRISTV